MNIDDEWDQFTYASHSIADYNRPLSEVDVSVETTTEDTEIMTDIECPKASDIYISTKSKIAHLNSAINLQDVFWKLKVIPYNEHCNGIVKKQMKFNSTTQEEVDDIATHLEQEEHVTEQVFTSVSSPSGLKTWFKDVRKISVGISKKDILSYRSKPKCAFYNCFVMILRVFMDDENELDYGMYHEFHVKIFNTGKVEIPGIQTDYQLRTVIDSIMTYLQPVVNEPLEFVGKCDTVLINSNFNCGFFIHREALFDILKTKYNIQCIYDPCSYPGIQCKFYYDKTKDIQTGQREHIEITKSSTIVVVSFMIFRTGSILVVGMCDEDVLQFVYEFIKTLLKTEFMSIYQKITDPEDMKRKQKKPKVRKRFIVVDSLHAQSTATPDPLIVTDDVNIEIGSEVDPDLTMCPEAMCV